MQFKQHVSAIIGRVLLLFFALQIVWGVIWMKDAFLQPISRITPDGGLLYQAGFEMFCRMKVLYFVIQILVMGTAWDYLFQQIHKTGAPMQSLRIMAILTIPPMLQVLMTVTPYAMATAGLVFLLAFAVQTVKEASIQTAMLLKAALVYIFLCLWLQEFFLFGSVPLSVVFVEFCKKSELEKTKKLLTGLCIFLAAAAFGAGGLILSQNTDHPGKDMNSLDYSLFARYSQLHISQAVGYYPEEVQEVVSRNSFGEVSANPERLKKLVYDPLIQAYGEEHAKELISVLTDLNREMYSFENRNEILWDLGAYLATPVIVKMQLEGHGTPSLTKRNMEYFMERSPATAYRLIVLWAASFVGFALIGAVLFGGWLLKRKLPRKFIPIFAMLVGVSLLLIFWYTWQGGGIMDYRKNLPVTGLWTGLFAVMADSLSGIGCLGKRYGKEQKHV